MALGRDDLGLLKSGLASNMFISSPPSAMPISRRRSTAAYPRLQARYVFVAAALDLDVDLVEVALAGGGEHETDAFAAAQSTALPAAVWLTKSRRVY